MRKTIAAATMAASLTLGGAAGVALFTPTISGATATVEDGDAAERHEPGERLGAILAPLVEDGTITQSQADAVIETLLESGPRPGHDRPHPARRAAHEAVADVLGMSGEEVRAELAEGKTLVEIGAEQGVTEDQLVDAIVSAIEEKLAAAVENGRMTQEEADEKLAGAEERAREGVNKVHEGRPDRPDRPGRPGADTDGGDDA